MATVFILLVYNEGPNRTRVQHWDKAPRKTTPVCFRIGGELEESEIAEGAFLCATFTSVFVGFFLHSSG